MNAAHLFIGLGTNGTVVNVGSLPQGLMVPSSSNTLPNGTPANPLVNDKGPIAKPTYRPPGQQYLKAEETEEGHVGWKPSKLPSNPNAGVVLTYVVSLASEFTIRQHVESSHSFLDHPPRRPVPRERCTQRSDLAARLLGKPVF